MSYAQIAQKKTANIAVAEPTSVVVGTAATNSSSSVASSSQGVINGPSNNNTATAVTSSSHLNSTRAGQNSNAFREQGNYNQNPNNRPPMQKSPKEGQSRSDVVQPRMRRNSKENRTQTSSGKFDRKKPDGRPK